MRSSEKGLLSVLKENRICQKRCVVYNGVCMVCEEFYVVKTARPHGIRLDEHYRALLSLQSYPDNLLSRHRTLSNTNDPLTRCESRSSTYRNVTDPVERKIEQALEIRHWRPPFKLTRLIAHFISSTRRKK